MERAGEGVERFGFGSGKGQLGPCTVLSRFRGGRGQ